MKFTTFSVPKISDKPAATRNSNMPLISPPVVCVTRQEADAKHPSNACRSKVYSEWRRGISAAPFTLRRNLPNDARLRVTHRLFPLGLVFEDRLPVAGSDLRNIGLFRDGRAPAERVANRGLILSTHRDIAIGTERRLELHAADRLG